MKHVLRVYGLCLAALVALCPGAVTRAEQAENFNVMSGSNEILLSGAGWKLAAFPMGAGEQEKAYDLSFDENRFRSVPVPAEIQLTLGLEGMALYRQSKELTLINKQEWWYRKRFTLPKEQAGKTVWLVFEGLDYFTTVWLNGEKLGEHEGAYTGFSFDITSRIKPGVENLLAVKVTCPWLPKDRSLAEYMKGSFGLLWPGGTAFFAENPRALSFVWNGIPVAGNAAFTLGLIREVKLVVTPKQSIADVFVYTKSLNNDGSATLVVSGVVRNDEPGDIRRTLSLALRPANFTGANQSLLKQPVTLHKGCNDFKSEVRVNNAKLWWSWDLGSPNLYKLVTRLLEGTGRAEHVRETTVGIRTISRQPDMSYWLNGKHLFMKGVWYPMGDYYSSRNTRWSYEADLRLLRAANANYILNHTVVEKSGFYDLCDELGIMIMIQMPFNQAGPYSVMDPGDPRREPFIKMALEQGAEIVREHRNHPSIIVWSPLAESRWSDWAKNYGPIYDGMREVVTRWHPGAIYQASYCDDAEEHLWTETAGMGETGDYREHYDFAPAFVSEYGSSAMSSYENLHKWLSADEIWSDKNPRTAEWFYLPINIHAAVGMSSSTIEGLHSIFYWPFKMVYPDVRSAQELAESSQLYQDIIMRYGSNAFRRKKYRPIQGIRWWAYKDLAPGYQWGFLDYDQVPKMAYYSYKRTMAPLTMSLAFKDELEPQAPGEGTVLHLPVWVVNDHAFSIPLDVQSQVLDLAGREVYCQSAQATVGADESKTVDVVNWMIPKVNAVTVFAVRAKAHQRGGALSAETTIYLKVLPKPETPLVESLPPLDKKCRVLLVGTKDFSVSLASYLLALGVELDQINEDHLERLAELRDVEALRRKYDVIWLGSFEALWKVLDEDMAQGMAQAIYDGVGFIHSGGEGSFHGGNQHGACLDFTKLADVLPVKLHETWEDINLLNTSKDVRVFAEGWTDAGLKQTGIKNFNEVEAKEGSEVIMKFGDWPLVVAGRYGQGRTIAFMGYTPAENTLTASWLSLYGQMLVETLGHNPEYRYAAVTGGDTPLMQLLKQQPLATVKATPAALAATLKDHVGSFTVELANNHGFARLVRLRIECEDPAQQSQLLALYGDNYFDLFPGEKKTVAVEVRASPALAENIKGTVIIQGSNVQEIRVPVRIAEGQ
jgi:beta-mannosidase